jgi:hypothetical protein
MQILRVGRALLEDCPMKTMTTRSISTSEPFVDAREAAYTMNLPMYYLTNAAQRSKLRVPHYRIGRMVRFKLSELATWQEQQGGTTPAAVEADQEVSDE